MAPAQFLAGFFIGLNQGDVTKNIYHCFKYDKKLTDTLYDTMDAYIRDDNPSGDKLMVDTQSLYK